MSKEWLTNRWTLQIPGIAATNADPLATPKYEPDAHFMADAHGKFSLAHDCVGGTDVMIWIYSEAMKSYIRSFEIGSREIVPEKTLVEYDVPGRARIFVQVGTACNVFVGGVLSKKGGIYGAPDFP